MTCPECHGTGRIRKRFLLFFTRRARCPKCFGTGEFPPPVVPVPRHRTYVGDDDRDRWPVPSTPLGTSSSAESSGRDERFEVGSGGRSGGAGASASWDDASTAEPPVIADPFAGESVAADAAVADSFAADGSSAGSWSDSGSSSEGDSAASGDSGTSY